MRFTSRTALFFALFAACGSGFAGDVPETGRIAYISAETIFVTLGSREGMMTGDTLVVQRGGVQIGRLVANHVSEKSSSARPINGGLALFRVDDIVLSSGAHSSARAGETQRAVRTLSAVPAERTGDRLLSRKPRTRTRITIESYALGTPGSGRRSWARPSMLISSSGNAVDGMAVQHAVLLRLDRNFGYAPGVPDAAARIYQAWVGITPNFPLHPTLRCGRLDVPLAGGIGLVDGAMVAVGAPSGLEAGIIGGRTPDLTLEGFRNQGSKIGVVVTGKTGSRENVLYQGGGAFVREALDAGLDREWIVHEGHLAVGRYLNAGMGFEFDLAAADSSAPNGKAQLSSFWTNVRVRLGRSVSWGIRFNSLKFVKRLETYRSVPDSLWDDAQRYGLFTDARIRAGAATWSFGGGFHYKANTSIVMLSVFARLDDTNPFAGDRAGASLRVIRNLYVDAAGAELYDEKDFTPSLACRVNFGFWAYGYGDANVSWLLRPRLEAEAFWTPLQDWYFTASLGYEADPDAPAAFTRFEISRTF